MKIKNIISVFICAIALWSCNDAIDIEQPGRLGPEQAFQNVEDLNSGILGVYNIYDTSPEVQFNAVFTDELSIGFDNGGQGLGNGEYGFLLNAASSAPAQQWLTYHAALNAVNRVIEGASFITPDADEQSRYNNILGQAYALRAFAHFQIITYFSTDYTDDNALAGFLVDFVPTADQFLPRSTNGEVFTLINEDLTTAANLLTDEDNATFVSQDFVTALNARIAAYRQQYAQAITAADELLAKYDLPTRDEYIDVFLDASNAGIIFKLERTIGDDHDRQAQTGSGFGAGWVGANFAFVDGTIDGSPYFEIGRSLFNEIDPADVRYDVLVNETSLISPNYQTTADFRRDDILVVGKYPGNEKPLLNDLKIFRIAEMLLIKAEALAAQGNINGAANSTAALIKELRDARFGSPQPLPVYTDQQEAFGDILDERRIEFAFEGHRWKDLKRLGVRGNRRIERDPLDCEVNDACILEPTDFRFTMPIPLTELNANPNIRDQQNPGYN